ncbi:hypothetical protein DM860_016463 [Cuscuta australis]|uniref:Uncharacterized protein n=1 Tax=Cuscuta australis TaxID=267555 RepID=A0A328DEQ1_9ASTE|nr:hypothetical protein DM860_016463 [Cuscuta australis]
MEPYSPRIAVKLLTAANTQREHYGMGANYLIVLALQLLEAATSLTTKPKPVQLFEMGILRSSSCVGPLQHFLTCANVDYSIQFKFTGATILIIVGTRAVIFIVFLGRLGIVVLHLSTIGLSSYLSK